MASYYIKLPYVAGGGGGAVDSVNGQTGVVVLTKSSIGLGNVNNTSDLNKPISTATQNALDLKQDIVSATANSVAYYDATGALSYVPQLAISPVTQGLIQQIISDPAGSSAYTQTNVNSLTLSATVDSPSYFNILSSNNVFVSPSAPTNSVGGVVLAENSIHVKDGDISGELTGVRQNIYVGLSSSSMVTGQIAYNIMQGQIGPQSVVQGISGAVFGPGINLGANVKQQIIGFLSNFQVQPLFNGGVSFQDSSSINQMAPFSNHNGLRINTNIGNIPITANAQGVNVVPNIGTIESEGYYQGVYVKPNINLNKSYAPCLQVSNEGIINYAGVTASLVVQDITYTWLDPSTSGNSITIQYISDVTSGSEYAEISGQNITVHIESGVTDATIVASTFPPLDIADLLSVVITGVASNPQVTALQTNLAGGENPGNSPAAQFTGDVNIDGSLSFTGGLSIGALDSFANKEFVDAAPDVDVVQRLFTRLYTQPSTAYTGVDAIGVGTVSIIELADNSSVANGSIGVAALGLPAVLSLGTASTIDKVNGAVFVLALEGTGTGGTADVVNLCNAFAIPDGLTTVNNLYGYKMELPGGNPATNTWGLYIEPVINNHMSGSLTIGTVDQPTNSDVALEITNLKAMRLSNLTTAQRNALVALPGMVIFNTDTLAMEYYNGTAWV